MALAKYQAQYLAAKPIQTQVRVPLLETTQDHIYTTAVGFSTA